MFRQPSPTPTLKRKQPDVIDITEENRDSNNTLVTSPSAQPAVSLVPTPVLPALPNQQTQAASLPSISQISTTPLQQLFATHLLPTRPLKEISDVVTEFSAIKKLFVLLGLHVEQKESELDTLTSLLASVCNALSNRLSLHEVNSNSSIKELDSSIKALENLQHEQTSKAIRQKGISTELKRNVSILRGEIALLHEQLEIAPSHHSSQPIPLPTNTTEPSKPSCDCRIKVAQQKTEITELKKNLEQLTATVTHLTKTKVSTDELAKTNQQLALQANNCNLIIEGAVEKIYNQAEEVSELTQIAAFQHERIKKLEALSEKPVTVPTNSNEQNLKSADKSSSSTAITHRDNLTIPDSAASATTPTQTKPTDPTFASFWLVPKTSSSTAHTVTSQPKDLDDDSPLEDFSGDEGEFNDLFGLATQSTTTLAPR